jgi:hypothetical protein
LDVLLFSDRLYDIAQDRFEGAPCCGFAEVGFLRNDLDKFALIHPYSPWILGVIGKRMIFSQLPCK